MSRLSSMNEANIDDKLPKPISLDIGSVSIPEKIEETTEKSIKTIPKPPSNPYGGIIIDDSESL
jgi:hypothetical protein